MDLVKQRKEQAMALSKEARGEGLNLGKKISVPRDVQMEELSLQSNRGSRMFLERQRRAEKFTLENPTELSVNTVQVLGPTSMQGGKENFRTELLIQPPERRSLESSLTKAVSKKGSPNVLAPGYTCPLKEIPREKFNTTVIPKSYCSPWQEALGNDEELLATFNSQLPEPGQITQPANYRCFNRAPVPYGGPVAAKTMIPMQKVELLQTYPEPVQPWGRLTRRPNFNRAPQGWGKQYSPESNEL